MLHYVLIRCPPLLPYMLWQIKKEPRSLHGSRLDCRKNRQPLAGILVDRCESIHRGSLLRRMPEQSSLTSCHHSMGNDCRVERSGNKQNKRVYENGCLISHQRLMALNLMVLLSILLGRDGITRHYRVRNDDKMHESSIVNRLTQIRIRKR